MNTLNSEGKKEKELPYATYEMTPNAGKIIHFYISEAITEPHKYIDMIHRIKTAGVGDVIYIYLNTPGGQLDTGAQILAAMNVSNAKIVTVLEGRVCSLGTIIFLSGHEFVVHPQSLFMLHNFSSGIGGKGHEIESQLSGTKEWFDAMVKEIYIPFLSEDEYNRLVKGEDFWFTAPEVSKRVDKMIRHHKQLQKKRQQEEKAAKKTTKKAVAG